MVCAATSPRSLRSDATTAYGHRPTCPRSRSRSSSNAHTRLGSPRSRCHRPGVSHHSPGLRERRHVSPHCRVGDGVRGRPPRQDSGGPSRGAPARRATWCSAERSPAPATTVTRCGPASCPTLLRDRPASKPRYAVPEPSTSTHARLIGSPPPDTSRSARARKTPMNAPRGRTSPGGPSTRTDLLPAARALRSRHPAAEIGKARTHGWDDCHQAPDVERAGGGHPSFRLASARCPRDQPHSGDLRNHGSSGLIRTPQISPCRSRRCALTRPSRPPHRRTSEARVEPSPTAVNRRNIQ